MLYCKKQISHTALLGIWKIEELKEDLYAALDNRLWLEDIMILKSESRILEKLAVRVLLKELLGGEKQIKYYSSERPYLADRSYNISISHTKDYVAVILDREHSVAIDIEQIGDKVKRVRSRIISDKEYIDESQEAIHLLLHWSAKESMFKVLDENGVDYLKHLYIEPFTPEKSGVIHSHESRTNRNLSFCINYQVETEFVLVYLVME